MQIAGQQTAGEPPDCGEGWGQLWNHCYSGEEVQPWAQGGAVEGEAEDVHGQVIPHDDQEVREGEEEEFKPLIIEE